MKRPRLASVSALPDHRLELVFVNESKFTVDKRETVFSKPGLLPLRDNALWAGASLGDGGWSVEWSGLDIQIGADTLWLDALQQTATDPSVREFLAWRIRNGLSPEKAAEALGVSCRTITSYSTGRRRVPPTIILACEGWEARKRRTAA